VGGLSVLVGVDEPEEVSVDPKTVERTVRAVSIWPLYLVIPFFYTKTKGRQRVRRRSERPQTAQSVHVLTKTCGCRPRYCRRTRKSVRSSERQNTQCEAVSTYRRVERYDGNDPRPQELFRVLLVCLHAQYRVGYQQSSHTIKTQDSQLRHLYITRERFDRTYLCPHRTILAFPMPPA
jgi:hypothetical protein